MNNNCENEAPDQRPSRRSPRTVLVLPSGSGEARTGGQVFWKRLLERWTEQGIPLRSDLQFPFPRHLRDHPLRAALWFFRTHADFCGGVVVADQSEAGRQVALLRWLRAHRGVRLLVVVHHLNEAFRFSNPMYVKAAAWNETSVLRLAHRVVVHTRQEFEQTALRGVRPERLTRIPVGTQRGPILWKHRSLSSEEPLRLLWIGGDFPRKGLPTLLQAMERSASPKPRLTVVGVPQTPQVMSEARHLTDMLGLKPLVSFLGKVDQEALKRAWMEHDLFVLPSTHEGHGTAVDEALVCGMPAVVSDIPAFAERLPRDSVRMVPTGDVDALRGALEELRDDEMRISLSEAGLRLAAGFPTWEETFSAYDAVLRRELELVEG